MTPIALMPGPATAVPASPPPPGSALGAEAGFAAQLAIGAGARLAEGGRETATGSEEDGQVIGRETSEEVVQAEAALPPGDGQPPARANVEAAGAAPQGPAVSAVAVAKAEVPAEETPPVRDLADGAGFGPSRLRGVPVTEVSPEAAPLARGRAALFSRTGEPRVAAGTGQDRQDRGLPTGSVGAVGAVGAAPVNHPEQPETPRPEAAAEETARVVNRFRPGMGDSAAPSGARPLALEEAGVGAQPSASGAAGAVAGAGNPAGMEGEGRVPGAGEGGLTPRALWPPEPPREASSVTAGEGSAGAGGVSPARGRDLQSPLARDDDAIRPFDAARAAADGAGAPAVRPEPVGTVAAPSATSSRRAQGVSEASRGLAAPPPGRAVGSSTEALAGIARRDPQAAADVPAWNEAVPLQAPSGRAAPEGHAPAAARQVAQAVVEYRGAEARLVLDPEELGPVRLTVTIQDGGTLIQILAERPDTAEMMRRHADLLLQDLADSGVGPARLSFASGGDAGSGRDGGRTQHAGAGAQPGSARDDPGHPEPRPARRATAGGLDMRV